jgi:hypothetical protein
VQRFEHEDQIERAVVRNRHGIARLEADGNPCRCRWRNRHRRQSAPVIRAEAIRNLAGAAGFTGVDVLHP